MQSFLQFLQIMLGIFFIYLACDIKRDKLTTIDLFSKDWLIQFILICAAAITLRY